MLAPGSKRRLRVPVLAAVVLLGAVAVFYFSRAPSNDSARKSTFTFTAAGDYGASANTKQVLHAIALTQPSFHIALGDLSYREIEPESAWCKMVTNVIGDLAFELISGNHDSTDEDGDIENFALCLPHRVESPLTGTYGKEYYFDYPEHSPLARFILVSPELQYRDGSVFSYTEGSTHLVFVAQAIREARAAGIKWIIVGMHKDCFSPGRRLCLSGPALVKTLIDEGTDLVLQTHSHFYGRSVALRCSPADLSGIVSYDESCVIPNSLTSTYRGGGTVFLIAGTGGQSLYDIAYGDSSAKYFLELMGANENPSFGFVKIRVSPDELRGEFVPTTGSFRDSFVIRRNGQR